MDGKKFVANIGLKPLNAANVLNFGMLFLGKSGGSIADIQIMFVKD